MLSCHRILGSCYTFVASRGNVKQTETLLSEVCLASHPQTFPVGLLCRPKLLSRACSSARLSHPPGSAPASSSPGGIWRTRGAAPSSGPPPSRSRAPAALHPGLGINLQALGAQTSPAGARPTSSPALCLARGPTQRSFPKAAGGIKRRTIAPERPRTPTPRGNSDPEVEA